MNDSQQQQHLDENKNGIVDTIRVFWTLTIKSFVPIICIVSYIILLIITLNIFTIEINDDNTVIDWVITWRNIFWHIESVILMFLISYYTTKYQARNIFALSSSRRSIPIPSPQNMSSMVVEEEEEFSSNINNNNNRSTKTTAPVVYFDNTKMDVQNTSSDRSRIGITHNEDEDSTKTEYTMATTDFNDVVIMPFDDDKF